MKSAFVFLVLVCVAIYSLMSYHYVSTKQGLVIVRKQAYTLNDTFVDVSEWRYLDFCRNGTIAAALEKSGHGQIVQDALLRDAQEGVTKAVQGAVKYGIETAERGARMFNDFRDKINGKKQ